MKILVAGEINCDVILQGYHAFPELGKEVLVNDCLLTLGSASLICAAGLARLGDEVAFLGKVGRDYWGEFCLARMREIGIDVSRVIVVPGLKTGITVSISSRVDRALVTHLGAITELRGGDIPDSALAGFDHLHVSSFFLQEGLRPAVPDLFARATARGLTTSLDPGFDPSEKWDGDLAAALARCDVFLPNEVELAGAGRSPDPVKALGALANGRTLTAAKLGREGAMALDGGQPVRVPAFPVEVVDTTGAGDSFNAGFLHAWLRRMPLVECLRYGAACGALSTRGMGGTTTQAAEEDVRAMLGGQATRPASAGCSSPAR
ncbi:MAG: carbohydrate kinase family protein [Bryobacteraceae bacterium]